MKDNFYISFGIWIAALPFLGVPLAYKAILVTGSGIFLALVAAGPLILKKLHTSTKPKVQRKKIVKTPTKDIEIDVEKNIENLDKGVNKDPEAMIVSPVVLEENIPKPVRNKNSDIRRKSVV